MLCEVSATPTKPVRSSSPLGLSKISYMAFSGADEQFIF